MPFKNLKLRGKKVMLVVKCYENTLTVFPEVRIDSF